MFEIKMSPFLIEDLLSRVKKALYGLLTEKNLYLDISVHSDIPPCLVGDSYRLEHALANLVSNAAKFSPHRGNIKVVLTSDGRATSDIYYIKCDIYYIKFSVVDEGPGLTERQISRLFQPFSQLNPHELQRGGGSGVGLSLCKKIVEQHGGTINVVSAVGQGSTFYFIVPLAVSMDMDCGRNHVTPFTLAGDGKHRSLSSASVNDNSNNHVCRPSYTSLSITTQKYDKIEYGKGIIARKALVVDGKLNILYEYPPPSAYLISLQICNPIVSYCVVCYTSRGMKQIKRKMAKKRSE